MKQKLRTLFVALALLIATVTVTGTAHAVDVFQECNNGAGGTSVCKDASASSGGANPVVTVLKTGINVLSVAVGVAAVIMLVIGGLRMILANGDASQIKTARNMVIYALLGVAVAAMAQVIVVFVLNKL